MNSSGGLKIEGIITALLTPFVNGKVNEQALRDHVDFQIENGVHAIFPCGTMGEGPLMNAEQRRRVAEIVIDQAGGRVPVIVHVGSIGTATALGLAKHAEDAGADAVSSICPYYFPHDRVSVINYYKSLSEATDLPVFIYNNPGLTKFNITPDMVEEIAKSPNVVGVKDSSRSLPQITQIIRRLGKDFIVLIGGCWLLLPALAVGARGCVSSISNIFPDTVVEIYKAFQKGDLMWARNAHKRVTAIWETLSRGPYISTHKEALRLLAHDLGEVLGPLREMTDQEKKKLREDLREYLPGPCLKTPNPVGGF